MKLRYSFFGCGGLIEAAAAGKMKPGCERGAGELRI
jgi:hypothetical protein